LHYKIYRQMKSSKQANQISIINGLKINVIIFDDGHFTRVIGEALIHQKIQHLEIILSFSELNDFLRFSGPSGDKVQSAMVSALMNTIVPPYAIDVAKLLPNENIFTHCSLSITKNNNSIYNLTQLDPINLIQQSKNLSIHIKNFGTAQLVNSAIEIKCFQQLKSMFGYYLGLLELGIQENAARDKAEIMDDRLFQMARIAYDTRV
jgi:hypothetical protein